MLRQTDLVVQIHFPLFRHAVVHEGDVRSSAGSSEVLSLRRVDRRGRVVDVGGTPDVFARVAALVTVGFEFEFKVGEGEGVARVWDGDAVLRESERAADEKEAVANFGIPELVVPLACCESNSWSVDSDGEIFVVVVELVYTAA